MKKNLLTAVGRREFMGSMVGACSLLRQPLAFATGAAADAHTFGHEGEHFLLDGKPFQIISGDIHCVRVPREYWRDRLRKIRSMGLNTICTYLFWDLHEPVPGTFDFEDNNDAAAFLRMAQEEGLWVLLRPGPYVCSEWDFRRPTSMVVDYAGHESADRQPRFLEAARKYMLEVGRQLAPLQITRGGPIIMVQVENEYGSFGHDHVYMGAVEQMIRDAGFEVTLYTSDGSSISEIAGGTLPDALSVINFGDTDDPAREFANFAKSRQNVPRMVGEYWDGWFDHWGEHHHVTPPGRCARKLDWMLSQGISVNLYMVHGGTSFGFMSGANFDSFYQPDISSYDYDAPLDEAGRTTAKFHALQVVIRKHLPAAVELPALPAPLPVIEIPAFELSDSAGLEALLRDPIHSERPQTMEAVGQSYGFVLYRKKHEQPARGRLEITQVHDYALVLDGTKRLGAIDRRLKQTGLEIQLAAGATIDILVENMGRTNYGPHMVDDRKGITERVTLAGKEITGWEIYRLPLTDHSALAFTSEWKPAPAFHRGTFDLEAIGDTFLDMRGWGKGYVWVNGHNLGRYWRIGPQQSLFLPGPWLKKDKNEIIVLDLEETSHRSLAGHANAFWGNGAS